MGNALNYIKTIRIEVKSETHKINGQPFKNAFAPFKHDFDVRTFKSEIQNPSGRLSIIADEIEKNNVSYFIQEKGAIFKKKSCPILFEDEKLEHLLDVLVAGVKSSLFFTGRRCLIVFNDFIQSKWLKLSFQNLFKIFQVDHWCKVDFFKETKYDDLAINLRIRSQLGLKNIEVGWLKHIYENGWEAKTYNPTFIAPQYKKKIKIEEVFESVCKKAEKAIETDVLELIALEDFCLTNHFEIYKVGSEEYGAKRLEKGRLNFNKARFS